jgi:hypothetical protein
MSGADWDDLTSNLAVLPAVFLYPRRAWAELSERLLAELLITDGLAWISRVEALARLMAFPRARAAIIAACGALAADPTNQVIIEPLTILDQTADGDANRYVLAQLANPTSDRALRGALLASVEKIPRRHFQLTDLQGLARTAIDLLDVADLHSDARNLAAALLREVPAAQLGATRGRLSPAADATTRSILTFGQTALPDMAAQVVARVLVAAGARMCRRPLAEDDPMLARLLRELMFSPVGNERVLAGVLIAATPYREPVGAALAVELTAALAAGNVALATAILAAVPFVGRPEDRPVVERLAVAAGLPGAIVDTAAWTIGHVSGHSDRQFWLTAVETHSRAWRQHRSPASASALRGLTYALGIARHHSLLDVVHSDTRLPPPVRVAAGWWLNIPRRIYASAAR